MVVDFIKGLDLYVDDDGTFLDERKLSKQQKSFLGVMGKRKTISYFNIIDTEEIKANVLDKQESKKSNQTSTTTAYSVNEAVFNFFLKRNQFDFV
jgi:hypothetical protein